MEKIRVGFAMTGSFCTFSKAIPQAKRLVEEGYDVLPIMSEFASSTDTRFGTAAGFRSQLEEICGKKVISSIVEAEPIGPKKLLDLLVIAPCTGNTIGKLANGITDTCVTMATKSHLRNGRPVLIAVSTNDGLASSSKNIGLLMNSRNIYFVPYRQDDPENKGNSLVANFDMLVPALKAALSSVQIQPLL